MTWNCRRSSRFIYLFGHTEKWWLSSCLHTIYSNHCILSTDMALMCQVMFGTPCEHQILIMDKSLGKLWLGIELHLHAALCESVRVCECVRQKRCNVWQLQGYSADGEHYIIVGLEANWRRCGPKRVYSNRLWSLLLGALDSYCTVRSITLCILKIYLLAL